MSEKDVAFQRRLRDGVAVVTGAGSGMGRALATALAGHGCHVAIADVDAAGLAGTAEGLSGVRCTQHVVDVADRERMEAFAGEVIAAHGGVNMVFNNAGVAASGDFDVLPLEDFEWLMGINFWGVVYGCRAFLPHLKAARWGHLVNTSSIFGLVAVPTQSAYHAAKFAVKGFTDCLSQELRGSSVGVSCVMPGGVKTNIVRKSRYVASDNEAPTKEEVAALFETMARLSGDEAAAEILRGVARGKRRILVGNDARVLAALVQLMPVRYMDLMAWLQARGERRLRKTA